MVYLVSAEEVLLRHVGLITTTIDSTHFIKGGAWFFFFLRGVTVGCFGLPTIKRLYGCEPDKIERLLSGDTEPARSVAVTASSRHSLLIKFAGRNSRLSL